jgi:hypothetical protein
VVVLSLSCGDDVRRRWPIGGQLDFCDTIAINTLYRYLKASVWLSPGLVTESLIGRHDDLAVSSAGANGEPIRL